MRDDGGALHLASRLGVQVFERDPDTGLLDQLQLIETDADLADAARLWDAPRRRLLADDCANWLVVDAASGRSGRLERPDVLAVAGGNPSCHGDRALLVAPLESTCTGSPPRATKSPTSRWTMAAGCASWGRWRPGRACWPTAASTSMPSPPNSCWCSRATSTRANSRPTGFAAPAGVTCCGRRAMAVTDDDAHLFVLERSGEVVGLFSLDDPLRPVRLASFSRVPEPTITPYLSCGFAAARRRLVLR